MRGREFEIIQRYFTGRISHDGAQVVLGPGDDCAILRVPDDRELCISTDTLVAGVHFPSDAGGEIVAHRSLVANLSDLAAMGAECFAFTLALTLPEENTVWLEAFSSTLNNLVSQYGIPLVGGNLAHGALSVTISVLGTLPVSGALRRSGACAGDDVYVSGTLGDAAAGLRMLIDDPGASGPLVTRYLYPIPRLALGQALLGVASAAIDISDGLAADLGHICESSNVSARIATNLVPLSPELTSRLNRDDAWQLAVGAGDDYELCFTASSGQRDEIRGLGERLGIPLTRIGTIEPGQGVVFLDADGAVQVIADAGYQHFHES